MADKYQETHDSWDKVAGAYEAAFMNLTLYNHSYNKICDLLPEKAKVLELGCGPGNITRYLISNRADLDILGTDVSEEMLRLARTNVPGAEFIRSDIRNIADLNRKFDAIITGFCIPYISEEDIKKLIEGSVQLLNPNGYFYISYVPGKTGQSGYKTGSTGNRMYFYYHETSFLVEGLELAGFNIVSSDQVEFERTNGEKEDHAIIIAQLT